MHTPKIRPLGTLFFKDFVLSFIIFSSQRDVYTYVNLVISSMLICTNVQIVPLEVLKLKV